ncbi:MAG: hypothetical protein Q9227_001900 [Pyrenula ochraceoflavens]
MTVPVVAILTPAEGKLEEVITGMNRFADVVKDKEPGALRYQMFKQVNGEGKEDIVFIEEWSDMEAVLAHRETEHYKALMQRSANGGMLLGPADIKILSPVGGFDGR